MIKRILQPIIEQALPQQKITLLLGARRTGKTELLRAIYQTRETQTL